METITICNQINSLTKINTDLLTKLGELLIKINQINFEESNQPNISNIILTVINLHRFWCHNEYIKFTNSNTTKSDNNNINTDNNINYKLNNNTKKIYYRI